MRKIVLLFLTLSAILLAVPAVSQEGLLGFAIRETFVQCTASRWRGVKVAPVPTQDAKVELKCEQFWPDLRADNHANDADTQPSPFTLILPGQKPQDIVFSTWYVAIHDALQITPEPK